METVEVVGGVGASISYREIDPSEWPREFLATHLQRVTILLINKFSLLHLYSVMSALAMFLM